MLSLDPFYDQQDIQFMVPEDPRLSVQRHSPQTRLQEEDRKIKAKKGRVKERRTYAGHPTVLYSDLNIVQLYRLKQALVARHLLASRISRVVVRIATRSTKYTRLVLKAEASGSLRSSSRLETASSLQLGSFQK